MLISHRGNLQQGFSLFVVLITVVVLSIGLLGLAGLQFAGMRAANDAQEHTYAALLAQDIAERLRANRGSRYDAVSLAATTADCVTNYCDSASMKDFDRGQWYSAVYGGVPLPIASVRVNVCAPNNIKITIQWRGSFSSSNCTTAPVEHAYTLVAVFRPCNSIRILTITH